MKHSQDIGKRERLERGAARSRKRAKYKALIGIHDRRVSRELRTRRDA